jgi:hypothetical protein
MFPREALIFYQKGIRFNSLIKSEAERKELEKFDPLFLAQSYSRFRFDYQTLIL